VIAPLKSESRSTCARPRAPAFPHARSSSRTPAPLTIEPSPGYASLFRPAVPEGADTTGPSTNGNRPGKSTATAASVQPRAKESGRADVAAAAVEVETLAAPVVAVVWVVVGPVVVAAVTAAGVVVVSAVVVGVVVVVGAVVASDVVAAVVEGGGAGVVPASASAGVGVITRSSAAAKAAIADAGAMTRDYCVLSWGQSSVSSARRPLGAGAPVRYLPPAGRRGGPI
jgi:hypothetical protein